MNIFFCCGSSFLSCMKNSCKIIFISYIFTGAERVSSIPGVLADNKENDRHTKNVDKFIVEWEKMSPDARLADILMTKYGKIKTDDLFIEENETNGDDCKVHDSSNSTSFYDSFYSGKYLQIVKIITL